MKLPQLPDRLMSPKEMRREIEKTAPDDALVRSAMWIAETHGMTDLDRFTLLAYETLRAREALASRLHDLIVNGPPPVIMVRTEGTRDGL